MRARPVLLATVALSLTALTPLAPPTSVAPAGAATAAPPVSASSAEGYGGAVATVDPTATAAALGVLRSGGKPGFLAAPEAAGLRALGHVFAETSEIGAATAIEFRPGRRLLAVAEPTRRGGGSAAVVTAAPSGPSPR
jgi:gamma-glutamyltranspeptidase